MPTRVRIFIEKAGVLFRYTVETAHGSSMQGWRPTHRWALAVARRRARRLDGHDVDVNAA